MFFLLLSHLVFSRHCLAWMGRKTEGMGQGKGVHCLLFTTHAAVVDVFAAEKYKPRKTRCAQSEQSARYVCTLQYVMRVSVLRPQDNK